MLIEKKLITEHNDEYLLSKHSRSFAFVSESIPGINGKLQKLKDFQIAIPSWALGTGGTRFGRFSGGGEPRNLEEKIADVGLLHALNRSSGGHFIAYSLGYSADAAKTKQLAAQYDLRFDAVNSNTFQDQPNQKT